MCVRGYISASARHSATISAAWPSTSRREPPHSPLPTKSSSPPPSETRCSAPQSPSRPAARTTSKVCPALGSSTQRPSTSPPLPLRTHHASQSRSERFLAPRQPRDWPRRLLARRRGAERYLRSRTAGRLRCSLHRALCTSLKLGLERCASRDEVVKLGRPPSPKG